MQWHDKNVFPKDVKNIDYLIEIEEITEKRCLAVTRGYGFSEIHFYNEKIDFSYEQSTIIQHREFYVESGTTGWMFINRWRFLDKEYEVEELKK